MLLIEEFKNFILTIKEEDNIAIFYHKMCVDGLCSAIIVSKSIERITKIKPKFHIPSEHEINDNTIEFIKTNKIKKIIFIDLLPCRYPEKLEAIGRLAKVMIVDHHKFNLDNIPSNILFFHAEYFKPELDGVDYPASKLAFDLFSQMCNISDLDWISGMGLIADMGYKTWKNFVMDFQKKYKWDINEEDVLTTSLGRAKALLFIPDHSQESSELLFNIVYNARNPEEIIKNKFLEESRKKTNDELDYWVKRADEAEIIDNLVIYEISPKLIINSKLSTSLSLTKFKDKITVIIADYGEEKLTISARDQTRKIKVNELLENSVRGLEDSTAGGHIPAAGATIKKEDKETFKNNLIKNYKSLIK